MKQSIYTRVVFGRSSKRISFPLGTKREDRHKFSLMSKASDYVILPFRIFCLFYDAIHLPIHAWKLWTLATPQLCTSLNKIAEAPIAGASSQLHAQEMLTFPPAKLHSPLPVLC